jgi:predicted AAA+ superfamily ATPase
MIQRKVAPLIVSRLAQFPAVALLGARQVGKTTLAKSFSKVYFDLELEEERLRLDLQWPEIQTKDGLVVLDEAQNFPEIFPRLRSAIDLTRNKMGRFLILGSVSPALMKQTAEFLTGRIAIIELPPLCLEELKNTAIDPMWLFGGYPDGGILGGGGFPVWQNNYLDLLSMRDLPAWGFPSPPAVTKRFFKMLAASHGTTWNASAIGKSMGLSYHTVNSYVDYLEQAYLVRRLQPFSTNIRKRLVKSPKIYWRDSGLLHSLLNVGPLEDLLTRPWVGNSWEGWIIEQIIISLQNLGADFDPYYFRTSDGHEIDLVIVSQGKTWAIESKLTTQPTREDVRRLEKAAAMIGADKCILITRSDTTVEGGQTLLTDIRSAVKIVSGE